MNEIEIQSGLTFLHSFFCYNAIGKKATRIHLQCFFTAEITSAYTPTDVWFAHGQLSAKLLLEDPATVFWFFLWAA